MFHALHHAEQPFIIANVWDVPSARAAQQAGYAALGTSSAAISAMLGYADREDMPFSDLLRIVQRIRACTTLPLSVDIEAGYGDAAGSAAQLADLGVAGINIEDSVVHNGQRTLLPAEQAAARIAAVRAAAPDLFINARTDSFLLGHGDALQQAIARGRLYADISNPEDIQRCYRALLDRSQQHVGAFYAAVKTTGSSPDVPPQVARATALVRENPKRRVQDAELRELGISPELVLRITQRLRLHLQEDDRPRTEPGDTAAGLASFHDATWPDIRLRQRQGRVPARIHRPPHAGNGIPRPAAPLQGAHPGRRERTHTRSCGADAAILCGRTEKLQRRPGRTRQ